MDIGSLRAAQRERQREEGQQEQEQERPSNARPHTRWNNPRERCRFNCGRLHVCQLCFGSHPAHACDASGKSKDTAGAPADTGRGLEATIKGGLPDPLRKTGAQQEAYEFAGCCVCSVVHTDSEQVGIGQCRVGQQSNIEQRRAQQQCNIEQCRGEQQCNIEQR